MNDATSRIQTATNGNEWLNSCGHDVSWTQTTLAYLMPVYGMHARPKLLMVTKKTLLGFSRIKLFLHLVFNLVLGLYSY